MGAATAKWRVRSAIAQINQELANVIPGLDLKPSGGAAAVHRRDVRQLRRIEKAPLNRARHPMDRTDSDRAGLSAGLKLGRHRHQERGATLLINRLDQPRNTVISSSESCSGMSGSRWARQDERHAGYGRKRPPQLVRRAAIAALVIENRRTSLSRRHSPSGQALGGRSWRIPAYGQESSQRSLRQSDTGRGQGYHSNRRTTENPDRVRD
jgi:hypothetical protein